MVAWLIANADTNAPLPPQAGALDPLAALIGLLRPQAVAAKLIHGHGRWSIAYGQHQHSGFCVVLEGQCWLAVEGCGLIELRAGDFVLLPQTPPFVQANDLALLPSPVEPDPAPIVRHGNPVAPVTLRMLGGHFQFDRAHAHLLVRLLPRLVHVPHGAPGGDRLQHIVELVCEEAGAARAGRTLILERLAEVLLVEALRFSAQGGAGQPEQGLLAGLADLVLARALHALHHDPAQSWTVAELARLACVSRAAFAERFTRVVGRPPMQYLAEYRMAVARSLLLGGNASVAEVAERIGYQSASAFSTAFSRQHGCPPSAFERMEA